MAIPKKGSRKLVLDNETYRWLIRRKATYTQSDYGIGYIHVAVEHAEENGSVLIIYTSKPHPKDWATVEVDAVTPTDVEKWIRVALKKGWSPKEVGRQFKLNV